MFLKLSYLCRRVQTYYNSENSSINDDNYNLKMSMQIISHLCHIFMSIMSRTVCCLSNYHEESIRTSSHWHFLRND